MLSYRFRLAKLRQQSMPIQPNGGRGVPLNIFAPTSPHSFHSSMTSPMSFESNISARVSVLRPPSPITSVPGSVEPSEQDEKSGSGVEDEFECYSEYESELDDSESENDEDEDMPLLVDRSYESDDYYESDEEEEESIPHSSSGATLPQEPEIWTKEEILYYGLLWGNFDGKAQAKIGLQRKLTRFRELYGPPPTTFAPIFNDVRENDGVANYYRLMMGVNWACCANKRTEMIGRWGGCEENVYSRVFDGLEAIQRLKPAVIVNKFDMNDSWIKGTVDCVTLTVNEFRDKPSARHYDPKSASCGQVCVCVQFKVKLNLYRCKLSLLTCLFTKKWECALDMWSGDIAWLSGPHDPARPDICIFRGAQQDEDDEELWDRNALHFQLGEGNYLFADSAYSGASNIIAQMEEHSSRFKSFQGAAKSRNETPFTRLKSWRCHKHRFELGRGKAERVKKHTTCVEAVFVIIQYDCRNGRPFFKNHIPPAELF